MKHIIQKNKSAQKRDSVCRVKRKTKSQSVGFTLTEVLASMIILLIGILALVSLFPQGMKSAEVAEDLTVASFLAQQKAEDIKRQDYLWAAGTTAGPSAFALESAFRWQATVVAAGGTDRLVTVTVLWRNRDFTIQTKI